MFYHLATGKYLTPGQAFVLKDIQYPSNWLNLSTPEEKEAIGIVDVKTVGVRESEETHYVTEELVGAQLRIVSTPKPAEVIRQQNTVRVMEIMAIYKAVRRLALDSLTGIAARASWKKDQDLVDLCYTTQEKLLQLDHGLPEEPKALVEELRVRYTKLKTETAESSDSLKSVFPDLVV